MVNITYYSKITHPITPLLRDSALNSYKISVHNLSTKAVSNSKINASSGLKLPLAFVSTKSSLKQPRHLACGTGY